MLHFLAGDGRHAEETAHQTHNAAQRVLRLRARDRACAQPEVVAGAALASATRSALKRSSTYRSRGIRRIFLHMVVNIAPTLSQPCTLATARRSSSLGGALARCRGQLGLHRKGARCAAPRAAPPPGGTPPTRSADGQGGAGRACATPSVQGAPNPTRARRVPEGRVNVRLVEADLALSLLRGAQSGRSSRGRGRAPCASSPARLAATLRRVRRRCRASTSRAVSSPQHSAPRAARHLPRGAYVPPC